MTASLIDTEQGLSLILSTQPKWRPFRIDFVNGKLHYRQQRLSQESELIQKAIGWKKSASPLVWDTTTGLGREAFLMACLGCTVVMFERHPLICALLKDALARAAVHPETALIVSRMQLIEQCAIDYLSQPHAFASPEVVYCDPMFEARQKSALVKKDMQLLHELVGNDRDSVTLVEESYQIANKRLVVKRPLLAPPLKAKPDFCYTARAHRYDVYLK